MTQTFRFQLHEKLKTKGLCNFFWRGKGENFTKIIQFQLTGYIVGGWTLIS